VIARKRVECDACCTMLRIAISLVMKLPNPPRTLAQQTNAAGWPKSAEIIEVTGMGALEPADRAILNLLYQHAHDSGRMDQPGARQEVPTAELRFSMQDSNHRFRQSLRRLLAVSVDVIYQLPPDGIPIPRRWMRRRSWS
jgi:hypothetical protein